MPEAFVSNNAYTSCSWSSPQKLRLQDKPFFTSNEFRPFQRQDSSSLHTLLTDPRAALRSIHANASTALLTWRSTSAVWGM